MDPNIFVPIIEISEVLQGEGKYSGVPHLLIRTTGCPLRCEFRGSKCDTPYASCNPEKGSYMWAEVVNRLESYCDRMKIIGRVPRIMVTGGEPTIHKDLLASLLHRSRDFGGQVTLETAGVHAVNRAIDFLSLSPKMSNSVPSDVSVAIQHDNNRSNYDVMRDLISHSVDYQIKFVISTDDDVNEAMHLATSVLGAVRDKIYFMPEGDCEGDVLWKSRVIAYEAAMRYGVNYTDRIHLLIYRDKRRGV